MDVSAALSGSPMKEEKIRELEKKARIAELLVETGRHDGISLLLEQMCSRVDSINQKMCWDVKSIEQNGKIINVRLTELDRVDLNARRGELMSIIETFPEAQKKLEQIEKKIKTYER